MSKILTMNLPTGEFLLIISEVPPEVDLLSHEQQTPFREAIGAAAVLITRDPVEVVNADFDEDVRRAQ